MRNLRIIALNIEIVIKCVIIQNNQMGGEILPAKFFLISQIDIENI